MLLSLSQMKTHENIDQTKRNENMQTMKPELISFKLCPFVQC